ncbi:MAG: hypothetical protein ABIZ04_03290 [Opitutus sp.]
MRKSAPIAKATYSGQSIVRPRVAAEVVIVAPVRVSAPEPETSGDEVLLTPELVARESINVWPDEAAEAAFLAESRGSSTDVTSAAAVPVAAKPDETASSPLPSLDELVSRIPTDARELLEELFRAKFTAVRRVKQADLKV